MTHQTLPNAAFALGEPQGLGKIDHNSPHSAVEGLRLLGAFQP